MSELHGRLRGTSFSGHAPKLQTGSGQPSYSERIHRRIRFLEGDQGSAELGTSSQAEAEQRKRLAPAVVAANLWMQKTKASKTAAASGGGGADAAKSSPLPAPPPKGPPSNRAPPQLAATPPPKKVEPKQKPVAMTASRPAAKPKPEEEEAAKRIEAAPMEKLGQPETLAASKTVPASSEPAEEGEDVHVRRGVHDPFLNRYRRESVMLQNETYRHFDIEDFKSSVNGTLRTSDKTLDELSAWMVEKKEREAAKLATAAAEDAMMGSGPLSPSSLTFLDSSLDRFESWKPSPQSKNGYVVGADSPLQQRYLEHMRHREQARRLDERVNEFSREAAATISPMRSRYFVSSPSRSIDATARLHHMRVYSPGAAGPSLY